ncbi:MAG: hypothetical protein K9N05_03020 [Candidatus Marinimicrobia bacterium]|nr:hypothetical protein [Candidatus Neomarinimicrobiota bacterium]
MNELKQTQKWIKPLVVTLVFLIPLLYFFSPMIFNGQRPTGVDISASKGSTNLYVKYQQENGEKALWNPNVFAGMPVYPRITPNILHADSFINQIGKVIYTYFWYYLIGALGIFFLLYYKKIPWYIALIPALAYMLLPHWMALLHVGHFAKLRAFMIIPWVILSFNYLVDKRSWLSVGLFTAAFSWIMRTQHVQVTFYGILILLFLFLVPVVRLLFKKEWKVFGDLAMKVAVAIVLTVAVSSQPFISLQEYTPYSTRGGNAVQMDTGPADNSESKGAGLDYATRWSLDGKGIVGFVIPRFSGGLSQETYEGDKYPQLKGRAVPGYWGEMPFTQSYDFVGILIFIFACFGVYAYWKKDGFVRGLAVFSVFATLLGLGRHFLPLYKLFFQIVPYFSKFRVPSMIMNMVFLALIILAGYGIKAIIEEAKKANWKLIAGVFGGAAGLLLIILLFSGGFAYEKAGEAAKYGAQAMSMIKDIRKEFLQADVLKALILVIVAGSVLFTFSFKKIKPILVYILLGLLVSLELFGVSNRAYKNMPLGNPASIERREFRQTDITRYLSSQPKNARAFALGQDSNHYSYFYPTISGYSAIKLQTIQDLREHCLYTATGVNWNVVNMLGGRYIIAPGRLQEAFLQAIAGDESRQEILYLNNGALPKAWFVNELKTFSDNADILRYMNTKDFDPEKQALLLDQAIGSKSSYSPTGSIILQENDPNRLSFTVDIPEAQFVVFSEMYYPEGWKLKKGEKEIPIIQTNYALRGAEIPAGKYTLTMDFHPMSYHAGLGIVWIGDALMLMLIGGSIFLTNRDKLFKKRNSKR